MRLPSLLIIFFCLSSCAKAPLDRLADESTRAGVAALRNPQTRNASLAIAAQKPIRVYYLAKYQATPEQVLEARKRVTAEQSIQTSARRASVSERTQTPQTRYKAVPVKSRETAPEKAVSVMIYDTSTDRLVGNEVFELPSVPRESQSIQLETYTMQYIGN